MISFHPHQADRQPIQRPVLPVTLSNIDEVTGTLHVSCQAISRREVGRAALPLDNLSNPQKELLIPTPPGMARSLTVEEQPEVLSSAFREMRSCWKTTLPAELQPYETRMLYKRE